QEFRIREAVYQPLNLTPTLNLNPSARAAGGTDAGSQRDESKIMGKSKIKNEEHEDEVFRAAFIADHSDIAFEAIGKELTRRIRKSEEPISEMRILEPGIWSVLPERCFALELRTSGTQEVDFRLHAPDSDSSRDEFLHTRSS